LSHFFFYLPNKFNRLFGSPNHTKVNCLTMRECKCMSITKNTPFLIYFTFYIRNLWILKKVWAKKRRPSIKLSSKEKGPLHFCHSSTVVKKHDINKDYSHKKHQPFLNEWKKKQDLKCSRPPTKHKTYQPKGPEQMEEAKLFQKGEGICQ